MTRTNRGWLSDPAAQFGVVKQLGLGREGGFDRVHKFLLNKYISDEILLVRRLSALVVSAIGGGSRETRVSVDL